MAKMINKGITRYSTGQTIRILYLFMKFS